MKKWNLSPSSLGTYINSQLQFYYTYLSDENPDTEVVQAYGLSGRVVHSSLEHYHKYKDKQKSTQYFIKQWETYNLDNLKSLNGKPLSKQEYYTAFLYGCELIEKQYKIIKSEMEIVKAFREGCNIKGFIDVVAEHEGEKCIMDYKTSSSMDTDTNGTFRTQVLFYAHLYWRETGEIINKARIEYLKLQKEKPFTFTDDEVKNFEKDVLIPIWNEIQEKNSNQRNYELGDWENPFNSFKKHCYREKLIRDNAGAIQVFRQNNKLIFKGGFTGGLRDFVNEYFSYPVEGAIWSDAYKRKQWDGNKYFLKGDTLPYSFIWKLQELIDAYNKQMNTTYWLDLTDLRNKDVVNSTYQTKFKENDFTLRPYQVEAVEQAMQKKVGIIFISCSGGKSFVSAELIKRTNRRTLFLVSRIELVRQTKEEYENYLGVEVGEMSEGNISIDKQITVASIQTIMAILKRKNDESKRLRMYLYNVGCVIFDEAQNVSDANSYGIVSDELVNVEYSIGLSGTPWRQQNETLELNSLCGFVIYKKTTKELEELGYVVPLKVYFLSTPQNDDQYDTPNYFENYESFIVKNNLRNDTIRDIVEKYKDTKKILVLTKSIKHGELLEELIPNSFFLNGSTDKKKRKDMFEKFKNENGLVMISMTQIFSAGINICDLDVIIQASAVGSDITTIQSSGRCTRLNPKTNKKIGVVIDFSDEGIFQPVANKRKKILKDFGFEINEIHIMEWRSMNLEEM